MSRGPGGPRSLRGAAGPSLEQASQSLGERVQELRGRLQDDDAAHDLADAALVDDDPSQERVDGPGADGAVLDPDRRAVGVVPTARPAEVIRVGAGAAAGGAVAARAAARVVAVGAGRVRGAGVLAGAGGVVRRGATG